MSIQPKQPLEPQSLYPVLPSPDSYEQELSLIIQQIKQLMKENALVTASTPMQQPDDLDIENCDRSLIQKKRRHSLPEDPERPSKKRKIQTVDKKTPKENKPPSADMIESVNFHFQDELQPYDNERNTVKINTKSRKNHS